MIEKWKQFKSFNPYYSAPSKNKIFRNFFRINMFAIVSNLRKKILFFVKTPKNNFLDPKLQTSIKSVGDILIVGTPKNPPFIFICNNSHEKKLQIWYIFFNTQPYNLFVKKMRIFCPVFNKLFAFYEYCTWATIL